MECIAIVKSLSSAFSGSDDSAGLSRRSVLGGIVSVGAFTLLGSTLLGSRRAEALTNLPVIEPEAASAAPVKAEVTGRDVTEDTLTGSDTAAYAEFSAQRRRRPWLRRPWRRRYRRVVCRRRWIRGRLVQVCRRVWW